MEDYFGHNKRYYTLSQYYKRRGVKMQKAIVNIGCTCPNVDGTKSSFGCIYCDGSSSYFKLSENLSVTEQLETEAIRIRKKWGNIGITAYFQSGTNTYLSTDKLRHHIEECLKFNQVKAVSIATRPDCIEPDMLLMLSEIAKKCELTVELGLQTVNDETAEIINRCYDYSIFEKTYALLKKENIRVCVHMINGLPNENEDMMIESIKKISKLKPDGIKIHLLHVLKGTVLSKMYENGEYTPLELDEYIRIVARQLCYLNIDTVIERITGDADKERLLAPLWSRDKIRVLGSIDKYMRDNNIYQSMLFEE